MQRCKIEPQQAWPEMFTAVRSLLVYLCLDDEFYQSSNLERSLSHNIVISPYTAVQLLPAVNFLNKAVQ